MPERPELPVRRASTLTLKVARVDWAPVIAGTKTQFRGNGRGSPTFDNVQLPRPVVLYSVQPIRRDVETRLAVLERVRREPLASISPEDLAAEGMADLKEFRLYWTARHRNRGHGKGAGFKPLQIVNVYELSLWREGDRERFGDVFMQFFYGPFL